MLITDFVVSQRFLVFEVKRFCSALVSSCFYFFLNFYQTCSVFIAECLLFPIYALFGFFCYIGLVIRIYDNLLLSYHIIDAEFHVVSYSICCLVKL